MRVGPMAHRSSARAWTAVALYRFDTAPSIITAPTKLRTIMQHYPFATSILQNEIASRIQNFRGDSLSLALHFGHGGVTSGG